MARNKVNENFIKELMGIDSPIKIFTSMWNILKFLDKYLDNINYDFEGLDNQKWSIYGLLYDLLDDWVVSVSEWIKENPSLKLKGWFRRWFFQNNNYEKYITLSELDRYTLILEYYKKNDKDSKLDDLEILENEWWIQFELSSQAKWKIYNDKANEYGIDKIFIPRYKDKEYNEVLLSQKIKELLNFDEKDSKQNKSGSEQKQKDFFPAFLVENKDNPQIVTLLNDYREMWLESQIQSVLNDRMKQFNDKLKEVNWKVDLITKLKNMQVVLNNLNNTIFASIIFSYIVNEIKVYKTINYLLIEKIILSLDKSNNDNHWVKRFFKQLNDKNCTYPNRLYTWTLQNLFVIILFVIAWFVFYIFLPPIFIILLIVFLISSLLSNRIKSDFLLYRINSWFRLLIIMIWIFSFIILWTVYHFDNIKSSNTTINKLFLKNTQEYILWTDKNENCYNYNYFKKWKSCFEE